MSDFDLCKNQDVVLLCSSGMDSTLLNAIALANGNSVHPLFVHWGFAWEDAERNMLQKIVAAFCHSRLQPVQEISISGQTVYNNSWMFTHDTPQWQDDARPRTNTIPGRNISLLSLAYVYAANKGIDNVILGISGHAYPDAKQDFLDQFVVAMNIGLSTNIRLYCPLPSASTEQIAAFVQDTPTIPWNLSFSCYNPTNEFTPCGDCYKCTETKNKRLAWQIDK